MGGVRFWTCIAVTGALTACASSLAPRARGPAADVYFPMVAGTQWVYQVHTGPSTIATLEVTARGPTAVPGVAERLFIMEERSSAALFGAAADGVVGYASDGDFVRRVEALAQDESGGLQALGSGMVAVLPLDPRPGQRWSGEVALFSARQETPLTQLWTYAVEGAGRVDVPAGSFSDVILVRSWLWDASAPREAPIVHYEDYYARGVGLIRSISRRGDPAGSALTQELLAVRFGEVAGD
jgi:hypothetical protein